MHKKKSLKKKFISDSTQKLGQFNVGDFLATLFNTIITLSQGYLMLYFEMKHVHVHISLLSLTITIKTNFKKKPVVCVF